MIKKLVAALGAAGLLLGMSVPALASVLVVNTGVAGQFTFAGAGASSGGNSYAAGGNLGNITQSGDTTTGNAGAGALAQSTANQFTTEVWDWGWWDCECDVTVVNVGGAGQDTEAGALAGSGDNSYAAGPNLGNITQSGGTTTGNAGASAVAQSWANIYTTGVNTWLFPLP